MMMLARRISMYISITGKEIGEYIWNLPFIESEHESLYFSPHFDEFEVQLTLM